MARKGASTGKPKATGRSRRKTTVEDYRHDDAKRKNNPPAKIAAEGTVPAVPKARYAYDPHLPPILRFDSTGEADLQAVKRASGWQEHRRGYSKHG